MRILRTIGKGLGGFFFITCLSVAILMLTIVEFTEYSNLKTIAVGVIGQELAKQIDATKLSPLHAKIVEQCADRETIEIPLSGGENVTLKCSDVTTSKPEDLTSLIAAAMFEKIYYKKYDCEFLQCYQQAKDQEKIMLFVSSTANQFFNKVLTYLWVGTAVFGIILIVSSKGWEIPKNFGKSFIVVGVPFFFINILKEKIPLPAEAVTVQPVIDQIFSSIANKLLIVLIIGVVLTAVGYAGSYLTKKTKKGKTI